MVEQPDGADIVEQGGRQFRLPGGWRPARAAGVLAATTLAVGLAAGYTAGNHQARSAAPLPGPTRLAPPSPASAPPSSAAGLAAPATAFSFADPGALTQNIASCSVQNGRDLQLGVQITNQSPVSLTLKAVKAVTPMGALKQVTGEWGPCGALPNGLLQADNVLSPGQSTWLTVTFAVTVHCPGAYPVQFTVGYLVQGHRHTASLPGFPDLGQVPYSGCAASVGAAAAQSTFLLDPDTGAVIP
jgi:hypothetical protein